MTAVHQVVAGAGPYDAVSEQVRSWRRLLRDGGYGGTDHAAEIDPRARADFAPISALEPAPGDLLVIRYSAWAPELARLLAAPQRKLLVYHNITPPRFLWNHSPRIAFMCAVGRLQLPAFARGADVAVADSEFNVAELRAAGAVDARVVPILFDPRRLDERGTGVHGSATRRGDLEGVGPLVLTVGRLVPNKRHDLVIAAFAAYQREHAPAARLLCIGQALTPGYGDYLRRLVSDSRARGITFAGALPQPEVNAAYAAADAMLHLSEHEGFCIPLLEAFHFGLPVVARPEGAMPGVGGDAVLWTDRDLAVTAELLSSAVSDAALRGELERRGRARLAEFAPERTAEAVHEAVRAALER